MDKRMITKVLPFEIKEVAPRTLEFVGSTEDTDREGDIIMASGWQLRQYKKNPVFMWAHQYGEPPIGKATEVWANDGKLRFHVQFAEKEEYEFADTIYKLYKGGYLRATSVGFLPIKSEPIEVKEDEEDFFSHRPTRFVKQELLELSGCPVPANPNALAEAKAKGIIGDTEELAKKSAGWAIIMGENLEEKPYPNEHACRLRNPDDFQDGSFKRTTRTHDGKQYSVIMGRLTGEDSMTEQAYRYHKEIWTAPEARTHCNDHDGIFEAAKSKEVYNCECIECGYTMESEKHCKDIKCPECGGDMRRVERPGPGTRESIEDASETSKQSDNMEKELPSERAISQAAIADDLDYLITAIHDQGLNEANSQLAWALVDVIMRDSGSDIPVDIAEKIGAVLNKLNRERLETIQTLAQEVLDSAEKEEDPEKSLTREEIQESISNSVVAAIEKAKGKLRR